MKDPKTEAPYPFQELLGFKMVDWSMDYCRFEMPLGEKHQNRYGIPHGGLYATLLDTVMGFAGCYTGDLDNKRLAMTLSMTTNFLSRPEGDLLVAEGFRTGGGKKSFFARGEVTDSKGNVVATATGVFRYRS
jgi:uncharacterized protein (TIGR00369 family)